MNSSITYQPLFSIGGPSIEQRKNVPCGSKITREPGPDDSLQVECRRREDGTEECRFTRKLGALKKVDLDCDQSYLSQVEGVYSTRIGMNGETQILTPEINQQVLYSNFHPHQEPQQTVEQTPQQKRPPKKVMSKPKSRKGGIGDSKTSGVGDSRTSGVGDSKTAGDPAGDQIWYPISSFNSPYFYRTDQSWYPLSSFNSPYPSYMQPNYIQARQSTVREFKFSERSMPINVTSWQKYWTWLTMVVERMKPTYESYFNNWKAEEITTVGVLEARILAVINKLVEQNKAMEMNRLYIFQGAQTFSSYMPASLRNFLKEGILSTPSGSIFTAIGPNYTTDPRYNENKKDSKEGKASAFMFKIWNAINETDKEGKTKQPDEFPDQYKPDESRPLAIINAELLALLARKQYDDRVLVNFNKLVEENKISDFQKDLTEYTPYMDQELRTYIRMTSTFSVNTNPLIQTNLLNQPVLLNPPLLFDANSRSSIFESLTRFRDDQYPRMYDYVPGVASSLGSPSYVRFDPSYTSLPNPNVTFTNSDIFNSVSNPPTTNQISVQTIMGPPLVKASTLNVSSGGVNKQGG